MDPPAILDVLPGVADRSHVDTRGLAVDPGPLAPDQRQHVGAHNAGQIHPRSSPNDDDDDCHAAAKRAAEQSNSRDIMADKLQLGASQSEGGSV